MSKFKGDVQAYKVCRHYVSGVLKGAHDVNRVSSSATSRQSLEWCCIGCRARCTLMSVVPLCDTPPAASCLRQDAGGRVIFAD